MTLDQMVIVLGVGVVGYVTALALARARTATPPEALVRTNVSGRAVPAVLGAPFSLASLIALGCVALGGASGWEAAEVSEMAAAAASVVAIMWPAGSWDDRRGDESSRGFGGHISSLRAGRLTGGIVKIAAGGVAGAVVAGLLYRQDLGAACATLLLVALGANTINLFDRAPGRAGKIAIVIAIPLFALGDPRWAVAAAGALGALLACLPLDLGERAMLGDAGANPLGGLLGLGLAVSLPGTGRWVAVLCLLTLNLASERWSFSAAIANSALLRRLDRIGRK